MNVNSIISTAAAAKRKQTEKAAAFREKGSEAMCFCCCCCRCFGGDKQLLPSCRGLLATREELTTEMEQQLGDALLGHLSALLCSVNDDSNSYKGERVRAYSVCPYQGCGDSGRDDDDIVKGAELLTRERDDWIGLEAVVVTYRCQR